MDEQMKSGWTDGWTHGWMDGPINGWMYEWMDGQMDGVRWMNESEMDGWVVRIDGWMKHILI